MRAKIYYDARGWEMAKEGKKGAATDGRGGGRGGKTDNDSASPREREERRAAGVDRGR